MLENGQKVIADTSLGISESGCVCVRERERENKKCRAKIHHRIFSEGRRGAVALNKAQMHH